MIIIKPDWLRFSLTFVMQRFFMLPLVWVVFRWLNQVRVEGLEHLDEVEGESIIIAPNHTTAWDGFLGTLWSLSHRKRYVDHGSYTAVFAAPENIPTPLLKTLTATLGAIPVDREQGVEQHAMTDTVRLFREGKRKVILTCYPEGTRSKDGRLRRRGRPGIGWLQHQTKATVLPIYHVGGTRMFGIGIRMKVRIGAPLRFEHLAEAPDELPTWRAVTREIMESLRDMEREALDQDPHAQPPKRRWRNRIPRRRERPIAVRSKTKRPEQVEA